VLTAKANTPIAYTIAAQPFYSTDFTRNRPRFEISLLRLGVTPVNVYSNSPNSPTYIVSELLQGLMQACCNWLQILIPKV
jgi:hypothetical protein